jgi:hypothetical protein
MKRRKTGMNSPARVWAGSCGPPERLERGYNHRIPCENGNECGRRGGSELSTIPDSSTRQYTVKGTDAGFELLEDMRITTGMIQNGKRALRGGCRCAPARQTRA